MNIRWINVIAVVVFLSWYSTASADLILFQEDISPAADCHGTAAYIRSTTADPGANTEGAALQVGRTVTANDFMRSILGFNISAIPAGSTINSVTLTVSPRHNDANSLDQSFAVNLHRLIGDNFAENTVTWYRRNIADAGTAWATPGGDFDSAVLSSISANPKHWADGAPAAPASASSITYVFNSTSELVATAQSALDGNNGMLNLLLRSADIEALATGNRAIFQMASDDPVSGAGSPNRNTIQSQAPLLTIDFTPVPEPSSWILYSFAAMGLLGYAVRRRA
jgi:hypothetical protein